MEAALRPAGRALLAKAALDTLPAERYFGYSPSTGLAAAALALFVLGAAVVAAQTEHFRWRFMHTVRCGAGPAG